MSALPNPLHTQKKAPGQAARPSKLNKYGRDPQSPSERLRASSDYDTEKGYAPLFHAFLADWPRLSSGEVSCLLMNLVLCKSLGRSVKKGEPRPQKTLPLFVSEMAEICRRDERSIQRELAGWQARKIAKVITEGKGLVSIELLYRGWEALPDYKNVVSIETGEPEPEDTVVDEGKPKATRIEITKAPVPCRAGGRTRAVKIDSGVTSFHLVNPSVVDFEITAMLQAGDLGITIRATDEWQKIPKRESPSNRINDLDSSPRHDCHGPARETTSKAIDYSHPRAAELIKLFDPILAKSASRLLSGDSASLKAACEAVADCDHDYLVKHAIDRATREVKSPLHVKDICVDALRDWRASKMITGAGLSREDEGPQLSPQGKRIAEGLKRIREAEWGKRS